MLSPEGVHGLVQKGEVLPQVCIRLQASNASEREHSCIY